MDMTVAVIAFLWAIVAVLGFMALRRSRVLFKSGLKGGNGEDVASESVKEKIRGIIGAEDPRKPYSDQHIAAMLSTDSIDIARRTVAKYREAMGILASSKRRQPFLRR